MFFVYYIIDMIAIFRHGETIANKEGYLQGWTDSPLTDLGIEQATKTADHFFDNHPWSDLLNYHLYSSTSGRSVDSAKPLVDRIPFITMTTADSLKERNYGDMEKRKIKTFASSYNQSFINGESLADVYERVSLFLDRNQVRQDDPTKLVVFHVHGNVSKILRGILLRIPSSIWLEWEHDFLCYYVIQGNHCQEIKCE